AAHHQGDRADRRLRARHHHGPPVPCPREAAQEDDCGGALMSDTVCPDIEVLFTELEAGEGPALDHASDCPACQALMEDHRLLEKDLFRLSDPLPPPDLIPKVMSRVATEPIPLRRELWSGGFILLASMVVGLGLLISSDVALGRVGRGLAA